MHVSSIPGTVIQGVGADLVVDYHTDKDSTEGSASFSRCGRYRYVLTRRWSQDGSFAVFIMLNPSTADAFRLDPTIRRCISFARDWRCAGLSVVNLFSLRSTDPHALYAGGDIIGPGNDDAIVRTVLSHPGAPVVCAWGAHGALASRGADVTRMLQGRKVPLLCLGVTRHGHPRHPLYLASSTALRPFLVEGSGA